MPILTGFEAVCALWNWERTWSTKPQNIGRSYGYSEESPILQLTVLRNTDGRLTRHVRSHARLDSGDFRGDTTRLDFVYKGAFYYAYWNPYHSEPEEPGSYGSAKDLLVSIEFDQTVSFSTTPLENDNYLSRLREWQRLPRLNPLETERPIIKVHERDDYPNIRIKTKKPLSLGAPGLFQPVHYAMGEIVGVRIVDYPGKPLSPGSSWEVMARKKGEEPVYSEWAFWTSGDVDCSAIFKEEDVDEVIIPDTQKWREIFNGSPFKVTIDPES